MIRSERGVSEILGFVISFSIIMLAVGVTYAGGFGAVMDMQTSEREQNAERAMVALAETFEDVERGNGPARAGEIRLDGGTLSVENSSKLRILVDNGTAMNSSWTKSLAYSSDDTTLRYEHGAVIRSDGGAARIRSAPGITCTPEFAIVSLVDIGASGSVASTSSSGSVLVSVSKTELSDSKLLYPRRENGTKIGPAADNVSVSIESSPHEGAWQRWLQEREGWQSQGDGSFECETEEVFVRRTTVDVELIG